MIEIFFIFTQLILFISLTAFPINKITSPLIYRDLGNSNLNCLFANVVVLLFILLIFSFLKIGLSTLFYLIILFYLTFFLFFFKKIFIEVTNIKYFTTKIFFIFINLFLFFDLACNLTLGWDGLATWIHKTNLLYNNKNYFDLFGEDIIFKQYPHLGSYTWAFFWKNSLMEKEYFGRLFLKYIYVVSLFVVAFSIKNISIFIKILIVFFLFLLSQDYDFILEGYQDYLIFSLLIFISKLIQVISLNKSSNKSPIIFVLLLISTCLLPWIKNEGVFYSIFVLICFFFINTNFLFKLFFLFFTFINVASQIVIIKIIYKLDTLFQISLSNFFIHADIISFSDYPKKIFYILLYLTHGFFKYPIAIINLLTIFLIFHRKKFINKNNYFFIFYILNLTFILSIYLFTKENLIWHLQTSIKRLVLQTSGFYLFLTVALINNNRDNLLK